MVGEVVGTLVGDLVGTLVGEVVGTLVGEAVGEAVGPLVGEAVAIGGSVGPPLALLSPLLDFAALLASRRPLVTSFLGDFVCLVDLDDLLSSEFCPPPALAQMAMEAKVNVKRDNFIVEKKSIICLDS